MGVGDTPGFLPLFFVTWSSRDIGHVIQFPPRASRPCTTNRPGPDIGPCELPNTASEHQSLSYVLEDDGCLHLSTPHRSLGDTVCTSGSPLEERPTSTRFFPLNWPWHQGYSLVHGCCSGFVEAPGHPYISRSSQLTGPLANFSPL